MADIIRCPVCGSKNPNGLERCRACNQLLDQDTKELGGFGERIASGHTPTEKKTSELEKALPAWLRRARKTDGEEEETKNAPATKEDASESFTDLATDGEDKESVLPDFSFDAEEDDEDAEEESADWLAGLADSADDDEDEDAEEESADWLADLQGDLPLEEIEETEEAVSPDTDIPVVEAEPDAGEEVGDWLSNLQESAEDAGADLPDLIPQEETAPEVAQVDELPADDGVPDWLSDLQESADNQAETPVADPDPAPELDAESPVMDTDDSLPDWMSDLQSVGDVSDEEASIADIEMPVEEPSEPVPIEPDVQEVAEESLPDWMANLQGAEATSTPLESESPAQEAEDLPDWLAGDAPTTQKEEDSSDVDSDLSDWMSDETQVEKAPSVEESVALSSEDLPDWMSAPKDSGDTPGVEKATSDDLPDWLSGDEPSIDSESADTEAVDDLPDWISDIGGEDADAEESPEWLAGGEEEAESEVDENQPALAFEADVDAPAEEIGDDLPDWMAGLSADVEEAENLSLQAEAPMTETSQPEGVLPVGDVEVPAEEGETPEWLSRMGKPTTGALDPSDADKDEPSHELEAADEAPAWLDSLPGIDDLSGETEAKDAKEEAATISANPAFVDDGALADVEDEEIFGIDMPDWLSNLAPEDLGTGEETDALSAEAAALGNSDLSDAELPSWVQAMRPVESVVSDSKGDDEEAVVADSGPLAGLAGILPVGAGLGPKSKPQAHALKLRVNESQQTSARLLDHILENEGKALPRPKVDAPTSIPLLRWIIAGLMILAIVVGLMTPQAIAPSPNIVVPEVGATVNIINQLPAGGTVLLVFDYEAALSAEMEAVAAPVVDHLLLRGQKMAVLSSTPNGPALAERFLHETQSQHNYQPGVDYINLGYLPGGASGMLNFVNAPRVTVTGQVDGRSFWDQPLLVNISKTTDFTAVVILTDDVEKGRTWIEQASATLNASSTPFLMAVSAQAEPIIYPYYASGQVNGLVSGLNGGATYEVLQGQPGGLGRKYWDAYSIGLLTAEILIVVGAVLNFMAGLRARQKTEKDEE